MANSEGLVLNEQSGFTMDGFLREVYHRVPTPVSRARIDAVLDGFQSTYDTPDLHKRFTFFDEDIVLEDPVGLVRAAGRVELEAFFRSTFDNGVIILRKPLDRIVVGNQALERYDMRLEKAGLQPASLPHTALYAFSDAGLIRSLKVFFDLNSIGK
jgi:steroid delta-isomerase